MSKRGMSQRILCSNFCTYQVFATPWMSLTTVVDLELRISWQIFDNNLNGANRVSGGPEKVIREKSSKSKISWHCSFKLLFSYNWHIVDQNDLLVLPPFPLPHPSLSVIPFTRFSKASCFRGEGGESMEKLADEEINGDVVIEHLNRRNLQTGWVAGRVRILNF
jgi:hypothetical protein